MFGKAQVLTLSLVDGSTKAQKNLKFQCLNLTALVRNFIPNIERSLLEDKPKLWFLRCSRRPNTNAKSIKFVEVRHGCHRTYPMSLNHKIYCDR